jgi:hypothetical protein
MAQTLKKPRFVVKKNQCLRALLVGIAVLEGFTTKTAAGPTIKFDSPIFNFGKAMSGEIIHHDFAFINNGDATLEILAVTPSCGCTSTTDWTHRVEPGQTGQISLQLDTTRFGGPVTEVTTIADNDKAHYKVTLSFTGTVMKPVDVTPWTVVLKPVMDSGIGGINSSKIINHLSEPITIGNPTSDNPAFQPKVDIIVPGKEFRLVVHSTPVTHSTISRGNISMRTSSSKVPSITVPVLSVPQAPLVLSPTVVTLPAGPLAAGNTQTVSLVNNGRNPVQLTKATIDVPDAGVEIKEVKPGRQFALNLSFPAGFQLPPDREATLTIMTSNPQTPVLKVPLRSANPANGLPQSR